MWRINSLDVTLHNFILFFTIMYFMNFFTMSRCSLKCLGLLVGELTFPYSCSIWCQAASCLRNKFLHKAKVMLLPVFLELPWLLADISPLGHFLSLANICPRVLWAQAIAFYSTEHSPCSFCVCVLGGCAGDQTNGLVHARQSALPLS
jgi:hypothetical protein